MLASLVSFVFVLFSASYEFVAIFKSGGVLFGVVLLMGEFCVVWSSWANLLCWVSINYEWWLMFKRATKFLQGGPKLKFLLLWLVFGFGTWVSKF
jgi:hypothetical protein